MPVDITFSRHLVEGNVGATWVFVLTFEGITAYFILMRMNLYIEKNG